MITFGNPMLFSEIFDKNDNFASSCIYIGDNVSWIDLPPLGVASDLSILKNKRLNTLLQQYHSYNKTCYEMLPQRIEKLSEIHDALLKESGEYALHLQGISIKKRNYLLRIKEFYSKYGSENEWATAFAKESKECQGYITLKTGIYYNYKRSFYYGKFFVEVIDPCHRELGIYYYQWEQLKSPKPKFFLWLEDKFAYTKLPFVHYIDESELDSRHLCVIKNGRLFLEQYSEKESPVNCDVKSAKGLVFVVSQSNKLYISEQKPNIRHTSLSRGAPVKGAGIIWALDGNVQQIFFMSGHYLPSELENRHTIKLMQDIGIELDEHVNIKYFDNNEIISKNIQEYLFQDKKAKL